MVVVDIVDTAHVLDAAVDIVVVVVVSVAAAAAAAAAVVVVVVVVVVVESQTGRSWGWLCSEGGRYVRVQQE